MSQTKNILIAGVGGQGTILLARVLSDLLIRKGYDVKVSEIHGMSQRGGSIVTQVKYGEKVNSPIIEPGTADFIIGLEFLEAVRVIPFLKKDGIIIANTKEINPVSVLSQDVKYPKDLEAYLKKSGVNYCCIDGFVQAVKAGSGKCMNLVMLGAWAKKAGLDLDYCLESIDNLVPEKFREMNKKGFSNGYESV